MVMKLSRNLLLLKKNSIKKGTFRKVPAESGADEGSRTLLSSLGSWRSTDELHPHQLLYYDSIFGPLLPVGFVDAPSARGFKGFRGWWWRPYGRRF